jgi:uncharacterized iron-regulated membrane protein
LKALRKILFWSHLASGLFAAVVVIVMSVTGVLLTYQKQMTAWADRRSVDAGPAQPGLARLAPEELLRRVVEQSGKTPTSLTLRSRPDAPAEVAFGREGRELVNVYTGALLGEGSTTIRSVFRVTTAWHRTLGATGDNRSVGKAITGASNLAFLFLVVSGFFLWWPRNWTPRAFLNVLLFRRGLSGKARDFNWHHVIGFWSLVPLFIIVISGVVISYRWAGNLVYRIAGEAPPPAASQANANAARDTIAPVTIGVNDAFALAMVREPQWTTLTAQLPKPTAKTMNVSLDRGMGGQPHLRSQLVISREDGSEVRLEPFASQTRGRQLRSILRFAHTGEVLGVFGQTIAGLVSLGAVILAWTGVALSLRRLRAWFGRRRREPVHIVEPQRKAA